jgi:hypothetical protein
MHWPSVPQRLWSSAHRPWQVVSAKHVWVVPTQLPGLHWFDVHDVLPVHASPGA